MRYLLDGYLAVASSSWTRPNGCRTDTTQRCVIVIAVDGCWSSTSCRRTDHRRRYRYVPSIIFVSISSTLSLRAQLETVGSDRMSDVKMSNTRTTPNNYDWLICSHISICRDVRQQLLLFFDLTGSIRGRADKQSVGNWRQKLVVSHNTIRLLFIICCPHCGVAEMLAINIFRTNLLLSIAEH
jgi:hypothetical protein